MANGLPDRWTKKHGAFYYIVPKNLKSNFDNKSWYRLGSTEPEAYQEWARLLGVKQRSYRTMNSLFDRYMIEISPGKSPKSLNENVRQIKKLRAAFGAMNPKAVKPVHVYQYMDARIKTPVAANREVALLSHVFTKAIRWGAIEENCCTEKKVERFPESPRDRYIEDHEFELFKNQYAGEFLTAYLEFKYLVGQRKSDILQVKISDLTDEGIRFRIGKKRKGQEESKVTVLIEWTDELREAVVKVKSIKCKIGSIWLFANRSGGCYVHQSGRYKGTPSGFDSIWQRRMTKFESDGNLRFNEHDMRAKTATDLKQLDHANELMQHSSLTTTKRVYIRGESVVVPLKIKGV